MPLETICVDLTDIVRSDTAQEFKDVGVLLLQ